MRINTASDYGSNEQIEDDIKNNGSIPCSFLSGSVCLFLDRPVPINVRLSSWQVRIRANCRAESVAICRSSLSFVRLEHSKLSNTARFGFFYPRVKRVLSEFERLIIINNAKVSNNF